VEHEAGPFRCFVPADYQGRYKDWPLPPPSALCDGDQPKCPVCVCGGGGVSSLGICCMRQIIGVENCLD